MTEFRTRRLLVRDLGEDDLEAALAIYLGNPDYLRLTEGSAGEPGRYDLGMLQRDFAVAQLTPGRHLAGIRLEHSGELVGVLDWLEENPSDGTPWIGLMMIHPHHQRQGFASEAFAGLARVLQGGGARAVRTAVIERNEAGRALVERLGFELVSTTVRRLAAKESVLVLERALE